ncbi:hypothetical protein [Borreliella turdi]|uniref:hypothetical protein n=1 Tax=Borreliella turdi TaxID=57863 RepID=UPI0012492166|nr:hypothetical protein [Borreliella turdi]
MQDNGIEKSQNTSELENSNYSLQNSTALKLSNDANIKADNCNLENIDTSLKPETHNSSKKISNLKEDISKNYALLKHYSNYQW